MKNPKQSVHDIESLSQQYKPLYKFFVDGIKDIYWAEQAIETLLKKNKALTHTEELMEALEDHELQTHKHILRLEKVFKLLNMSPEAKKCEAMAGIIKEADECIGETPKDSMTRDAVMIIAAQKIEHYEIASYGGLVQIALTFGLDQIADILDKTLQEEEETDLLLTDIAESFINIEAADEGQSSTDDSTENASNDKTDSSSSSESKKAKATSA